MILFNIAGKCAYLILWILATAAATLAVAASVPSLAVLWFTLGHQNPSIDQYVVCTVDAYDSIIVATLLSMSVCMFIDIASCVFSKSGKTLIIRLCQSIRSTLSETGVAAGAGEHRPHQGSLWHADNHCTNSATTLSQAQGDDTCPASLVGLEQDMVTLPAMQSDDLMSGKHLDASDSIRGLEIHRGEPSPVALTAPRTFADDPLDAFDRADAEAEQAAITSQIHRLLQASIPSVDPRFAIGNKEELERYTEDVEDVELLEDMVTQWLQQREDLQEEKNRLLLLFHMRGLDSTSRLYEHSNTKDSHTPRLVVGGDSEV